MLFIKEIHEPGIGNIWHRLLRRTLVLLVQYAAMRLLSAYVYTNKYCISLRVCSINFLHLK